MMHVQTLIKMSQHRKRHHRHYRLFSVGALLFIWSCLQQQSNLVSALYLSQLQQVQPDQLARDGAILQALSQLTPQQVASGMSAGSSQVVANVGPNGAISIQGNGNSQNIGLVSTNNNNSIQTMTNAAQAVSANSQQVVAGNSNQFVIKWIHNDPKNQMAYVSIMPVNHTNLHEPRIELRYISKYAYVSIPESAPNNSVVAAVVVQDEDSGPNGETTLSIEQGNECGHFKLVSTAFTNTIQVNGPLSRHRVQEYNLTIVARDHGSPPKSSSSNLVIKVHPPPNMSPIQPPLDPLPSLKPPVTDLMYVGTMLVLMFAAVVILIIFGCALVQRPQKTNKHSNNHKGLPPTRTTSATNSRIISPSEQCSVYCISSGYNLTNL